VTFAGTRIFAGHLKTVEESQLSEVGPRVYGLDAQDFTAKLDDSVIDHPAERASESVADRVAWILGFLNYAITTAGVDPPSMTLDPATYDGMTVREALDQVADEARCHWYVDFDADLHLAQDEVVSAPFALDDTSPDLVTSFPYTEYRRARDSTDLATAVYVQGESDQSWVTDSGAIATYGRQERSVNDGDLRTSTQRSRAGDRALAEQAAPVVDGSLVCWEPGLRGGMKATLRNDLWALDTTIVLVSVDVNAVDPHDEDGAAYLRCEVRFRDRRKRRSSHRDVTNKNSRKRKGTSSDAEADVADGATLAVTARQSCHDSLVEDAWSGLFAAGTPYVGSWISQNTAYTVSGCPLGGGLWGPGGVTWEAWYTVSASGTDGILGARVEIGAIGSLLGVAAGGSSLVGWANAAPSHLRDFTVIGTIGDAGGTVFVHGSLIEDGGTNHLVIAPAWHATLGWSVCADVLVSPFGGPVIGGEGNSGRGTAPTTGDITITTLVTSGAGRTSWISPAGAGNADGSNDAWTLDGWNGQGIPEARWGAIILGLGIDYVVDAGTRTVTFREPPPADTLVAFRYRTDG
jgi:hypothetical protein